MRRDDQSHRRRTNASGLHETARNPEQSPPTQTKPGLRMKELTQATRLPKSTILHYVNESLLPQPIKTSPNMAYYDPGCVERVWFIKNLQSQHRLPLAQIRKILHQRDQGQDVTPLVKLNQFIFGRSEDEELDLQAYCHATGLSPEAVERLMQVGVLIPLQAGRFDKQDVAAGIIFAQGEAMGLKAEHIAFYRKLARIIVDEEMALRRRLTADLSFERDAAVTMLLTKAARAIRAYVIERVFQKSVLSLQSLKEQDQ